MKHKIEKLNPSNVFLDIGEEIIEVPWTPIEYNCFIAECYETEDEFWKEVFEDTEADYWIDHYKNNNFDNC